MEQDIKRACCDLLNLLQLSTTEFEHGVRLFAPSTALGWAGRGTNAMTRRVAHDAFLRVK
jgi:hypothetical protein